MPFGKRIERKREKRQCFREFAELKGRITKSRTRELNMLQLSNGAARDSRMGELVEKDQQKELKRKLTKKDERQRKVHFSAICSGNPCGTANLIMTKKVQRDKAQSNMGNRKNWILASSLGGEGPPKEAVTPVEK